jgi:biopolymer transport protein TolR
MASVNRGSSMRGGRGRRSMSEINVVPYIDVMLVLLVIFMVTAPLVTPGTVDLPTVGKSSNAPSSYIEIELKKDGSKLIHIVASTGNTDKTVNSARDILPIVQQEQAKNLQDPAPVIIAADKTLPYDDVMQVMSTLQAANVKRVGLQVKPSPVK